MKSLVIGLSIRRRWLDILLGLLIALCLARLWLVPLPSSFWVDETGTMFVVRQGANHPSLAIAPQVTASIYFWLPRAADALLQLLPAAWLAPGVVETLYRIPSLLAMAAACFVIARLAKRLIHPQAAWFAVFACMSLRGFNYQAADARPYALGTLVAVLSLWALVRWLDSASWRDAFLFLLPAALLWRVHLVYWPFYGIFALYAAVRIARKETDVTALRALAVFGALGLTLIPVLMEALALFRQAGAHVVVPAPGTSELWRSLKMGLIAECLAGAWLLGKWRVARGDTIIKGSSFALLAAWWLIQPLALFAFSWLTGNSVFVDRYLSIALPGAALMATVAASVFLPSRLWKPAAALVGTAVLLFMGHWKTEWPPHHDSNWRGAAAAVNRLQTATPLPVVCPSPFIEARPPVWNPGYQLPGFLYAPLATYPVQGQLILLPFATSPGAEHFAAGLDLGSRFLIYGPRGSVTFWRKWFAMRPDLAHWHNRGIGDFGDVLVVLFERE